MHKDLLAATLAASPLPYEQVIKRYLSIREGFDKGEWPQYHGY